MTIKQAKDELRRAFGRLTLTQRNRLRWHAQQKTPIMCGKQAWRWIDGSGGA